MKKHFVCLECKRIFEAYPSSNSKFCSRSCTMKYNWRDPEYRRNFCKKHTKHHAKSVEKPNRAMFKMPTLHSLAILIHENMQNGNKPELVFKWSVNGNKQGNESCVGYERAVLKFAELFARNFGID